jgi:hypothetical protein
MVDGKLNRPRCDTCDVAHSTKRRRELQESLQIRQLIDRAGFACASTTRHAQTATFRSRNKSLDHRCLRLLCRRNRNGADGGGAPARVFITVGGDHVDCRQDRLHGGVPAPLGACSERDSGKRPGMSTSERELNLRLWFSDDRCHYRPRCASVPFRPHRKSELSHPG